MTTDTYLADPDLVPLAERMRWMAAVRLGLAAAVVACALLLPELVRADGAAVAAAVVAYAALAAAGQFAWHRSRRRGLRLFAALTVLDGAFLALTAYGLMDPAGPLRALVVVHLVCATLLASFRTGAKLALWHSLLIVSVFHAQEAGLLAGVGVSAAPVGGLQYRTMLATVAVFWGATAATASFAAVNERELRRRRYDLEALAAFAAGLETAAEPAEVARRLAAGAAATFDFERVLAFVTDGDALVVVSRPAAGGAAEPTEEPGTPGALLGRALSSPATLLVSGFGPAQDPWLADLLPAAANLVLVPLVTDGAATGLLVCEHGLRRGSRIERRVVTMLERFASQAALKLANARLVERLQRTAATDGLTGIANRRLFDQVLGREVARARRSGAPVSLVLADLDHFKALNDREGHLAGDDALRRVARALEAHARPSDLVARYGGEEFALVLPGADATTALAVAERLRRAVAATGVTASFGVATSCAGATAPEGLIARADGALYASKAAGRDRVVSAEAAAAGA